jgi:hypothetical protein
MLKTRRTPPGFRLVPGPIAIAALVSLAQLAGCAPDGERAAEWTEPLFSESIRDHRRPAARADAHTGDSLTSANLVFASPGVVQSGHAATELAYRPEFARRDAALGLRPSEPLLATREWPEADRSDLAAYRRLWLRDDPREVIYFEPTSDPRSRRHRYHNSHTGGWAWWW